jgi:hypothetical protein
MPRPRYRQDPLPIGPDAPPVESFGPEQRSPPGLELIQMGLVAQRLGQIINSSSEFGD